MFSKSRVTEPRPQPGTELEPEHEAIESAPVPQQTAPRQRNTPSVLSSDLTVTGNIQIEGTVEGDVRAHQLVVGDSATIKGEIVGDEVIVHGRVVGRVRGLKVRLTATARVEGDIIHKTIAIESGAHFEGSVQRQDDPLAGGSTKKLAPPAAG